MTAGIQSGAQPEQAYWSRIYDGSATVIRGTAGAIAGATAGYIATGTIGFALQTATFVNPYTGTGTLGGKIVYHLLGISLWPTMLAAVTYGGIYGYHWCAAPARSDH